jgi:multimeric flavodoxin WrbA
MRSEANELKILGVLGSPRPKRSNTGRLLKEFMRGAQTEGAETEIIFLKEKNIHPCQGCYTCFAKTPGVCVFKDDMPELMEKVKNSDILVYATPLYNYTMTALMKAFMERLIPLHDPHLVKRRGTYGLAQRYKVGRKMVLISTCGFPELSQFDALRQVFKIMESNGVVPLVGEILVPAAEAVLSQECLREYIQRMLEAVRRAGAEVVRDGKISKKTESAIQEKIIAPDDLADLANLYWDSHLEGVTQATVLEAGKRVEDVRLCFRGMAATFDPTAAGDMKTTIQFEVTGGQPGHWYLFIENGKCTYHEGKTNSPNLTIKTPSEVWLSIVNKDLDGKQAFLEGKYTYTGDLGLLANIDHLFGSGR